MRAKGSSSDDTRLWPDVETEQLRYIANGAALARILSPIWSTIFIGVLYVDLFPGIGSVTAGEWALGVGASFAWAFITTVLIRRFRGDRDARGRVRHWARVFTIYFGPVTACCWGSVLCLMWEPGNAANHFFVQMLFYASALCFVGIWCGHWYVYATLQITFFGIMVARASFASTPMDFAIVVIGVPFTVTALYCGRLVYRHITDALSLRFRNERMAKDLAVARDEAQAANRAKSAFLANMSHELRTPLNAVIGFSDVIVAQYMGPVGSQRYLDYARDINGAGHHLLSLINDVLDISKIEAGRVELEPAAIEPDAIVDATITLLRGQLAAKKLRFSKLVAAGCPAVWADGRALTQVLTNLIGNAIKFTPEGGSIGVLVSPRGRFVEFVISDTGCGIAAGDIDRVFKPFEQADNRYARTAQGTGLGLALVKGLVALHHGRCSIESEPGAGTTVRVLLPAHAGGLEAAVA